MDCIELFKKAAAAMQTDPRLLAYQSCEKACDENQELQERIGQYNLLRIALNEETGKSERDRLKVAELNQKVSDLYQEDHAASRHGGLQRGQKRRGCYAQPHQRHRQHRRGGRRPHAGRAQRLHRQLLQLLRLPLRQALFSQISAAGRAGLFAALARSGCRPAFFSYKSRRGRGDSFR